MIDVVELSWEEEKKLEDCLYDRFIFLRCNGGSLNDVYRELGVPYRSAMAKRIRKRFKDDGFHVVNRGRDRNVCDVNIYRNGDSDSFSVIKSVGGKRVYFGCYVSVEVARMVRDKLVENDWDIDCLDGILCELGLRKG